MQSAVTYEMIVYGFTVLGVLIAIVSGYFWYRERGNRESARMFGSICIVAIVITILTFPMVMQRVAGYVVLHYNYSYERIYNVIVGVVGGYCFVHMVYMMSRRGRPRKWFVILADVAFIYIVLVALVYSYPWASTEAQVESEVNRRQEEINQKSEVVEEYARGRIKEKFKIGDEEIEGQSMMYPDRYMDFKDSEKKTDGFVFEIGFTYRVVNDKKNEGDNYNYYGYKIEIDDEEQCEVLEEGSSIGKALFENEYSETGESIRGDSVKKITENLDKKFKEQRLESANLDDDKVEKEERERRMGDGEEDEDENEYIEDENEYIDEDEEVESKSISIIGGADGPTAIFLVGKLGSDLEFIVTIGLGLIIIAAVIAGIIRLIKRRGRN